MRRIIGAVAAAIALAGSAASAQNQSAEKAAAAVAQSYFDAMGEGRWENAAELLDLKEFDQIRVSTIRSARAARRDSVPTAEELMRRDSTMPRAVAEYYVRQIREARTRHPYNPVSSEFAGVPNADSLSSLSPLQAAARWLEAKDPRWQLQHSPYADSACKSTSEQYVPRARPTVLATAVADTLAYAIVAPDSPVTPGQRARPASSYGEFLSVVVLRRQGGDWRLVPSEMMLAPSGFAVICESHAAHSPVRKKTAK